MNVTHLKAWLRTVLQVLVSVAAAIPVAVNLVGIPSRYDGYVAACIGIMGAAVVVVTAVQHAIESATSTALLAAPAPPPVIQPAASVAPGPLPVVGPGGPTQPPSGAPPP
jgi:hypothetical protein